MPKIPPLTESEWLIMARLWEKFPLTAIDIVDMPLDGKKLPNATVRTLLRRLVAKKAVAYTIDEHNANLYRYYPLVCRQDCIREENKRFMNIYYRGSANKLIASFMDDVELTEEEIEHFKQMLDAKKGKI